MRLPKPGTGMYVLYSASARSVFLYHVLVLAGPRRLKVTSTGNLTYILHFSLSTLDYIM